MTPEPATQDEAPLEGAQLDTARHVASEMHDALHLLLSAFPADRRTAKALASHLAIDAVVARRIVRAANQSEDTLRLLTRLPSVENLRKAQRAAISKGVSPTIAGQLLAAVDSFAALVEALGPGKAALTRRVRATIGGADEEDDAAP